MELDRDPSRQAAAAGRTGLDLVNGSIVSTLIFFALPTLGSNILQSLSGSVNAIWIGRFIGAAALAATSNANLVMFLVYSVLFGLSMASAVLVGQNVGRGLPSEARQVLGTSITVFCALSILFALCGWVATPYLLDALSTPQAARPLALAYLRVMLLSAPPTTAVLVLTTGLRGFGDALTPLWCMIATVALDATLNPILILGLGPFPRMGIAGSATATVIANIATLTGLLGYIHLRALPVRLEGHEWRFLIPSRPVARVIFSKGAPAGLQIVIMSLSALLLIGLVNRHGVAMTAAYGAINQLWTYVQLPALAIGAAVSAMVAQNIGANRWDRVDRIAIAGVWSNLALTGSLVLAILLLERHAVGLFLGGSGPEVEIAAHIHRIAGWAFIMFGATLVLSATMRANGVVLAPLVIVAISLIPIRFGFAGLFEARLGPDAIWWSFPIGSATALILTVLYYRFSAWKKLVLLSTVSKLDAEGQAVANAEALTSSAPVA